jgi:uncharacterized protein YegP (UPF0339 family)
MYGTNPPHAEFVVYRDRSGRWRWHLWSPRNREIVAESSQGYATPENAERSVAWVKAVAPTAPVRRA